MRRPLLVLSMVLAVLLVASPACAHEIRPAYLEIKQTETEGYDVMWKVPARGELRLRLELLLPPECEPASTVMRDRAGGAYIDRWTVRCPDGLAGHTIHIGGLSSTRTDVLARVQRLDGSVQTVRIAPSEPRFIVETAPDRARVAITYLSLGIEHILGGVDHLLFVLGLLFIVQHRWMLIKTITSFTIAHSLTLAVATLGYAYPPVDALNALIAMSILFLGPEIVRRWRGQTSLTIRHPWVVAFAFGLLHGFGFASGLADLGLPRAEIPFALLMFNVGVEAGQLAFVFILLGVSASLNVLEFRWTRWVEAMPGYLIGSLGAYWTISRVAVLFA